MSIKTKSLLAILLSVILLAAIIILLCLNRIQKNENLIELVIYKMYNETFCIAISREGMIDVYSGIRKEGKIESGLVWETKSEHQTKLLSKEDFNLIIKLADEIEPYSYHTERTELVGLDLCCLIYKGNSYYYYSDGSGSNLNKITDIFLAQSPIEIPLIRRY